MNRELDGVYFRIERNAIWESVCFSDMSKDEMEAVLKSKPAEYVKSLAISLATTLKELGDTLDISRG